MSKYYKQSIQQTINQHLTKKSETYTNRPNQRDKEK